MDIFSLEGHPENTFEGPTGTTFALIIFLAMPTIYTKTFPKLLYYAPAGLVIV